MVCLTDTLSHLDKEESEEVIEKMMRNCLHSAVLEVGSSVRCTIFGKLIKVEMIECVGWVVSWANVSNLRNINTRGKLETSAKSTIVSQKIIAMERL